MKLAICNALNQLNDILYRDYIAESNVICGQIYIDNLIEIKANENDIEETYKLIFDYGDKIEIVPRVKIRVDTIIEGEVSLIYPDNNGNYAYHALKERITEV